MAKDDFSMSCSLHFILVSIIIICEHRKNYSIFGDVDYTFSDKGCFWVLSIIFVSRYFLIFIFQSIPFFPGFNICLSKLQLKPNQKWMTSEQIESAKEEGPILRTAKALDAVRHYEDILSTPVYQEGSAYLNTILHEVEPAEASDASAGSLSAKEQLAAELAFEKGKLAAELSSMFCKKGPSQLFFFFSTELSIWFERT